MTHSFCLLFKFLPATILCLFSLFPQLFSNKEEQIIPSFSDHTNLTPQKESIKIMLENKCQQMQEADRNTYNVLTNYLISEKDGKLCFFCSVCKTTNHLSDSWEHANIHRESNIKHHCETTLHIFNILNLAGKKNESNAVVKKMFADIEAKVEKNIFVLSDGNVICRACRNVNPIVVGLFDSTILVGGGGKKAPPLPNSLLVIGRATKFGVLKASGMYFL